MDHEDAASLDAIRPLALGCIDVRCKILATYVKVWKWSDKQ